MRLLLTLKQAAAVALPLFLLFGVAPVQAQGIYQFHKVEILGKNDNSTVFGMNDQGTIAGSFFTGTEYHGFVSDFDLSNFSEVLGPPGTSTIVTGINSTKAGTGFYYYDYYENQPTRSFTLNPPFSSVVPFDIPNASSGVSAFGIAEDGTVVGSWFDYSNFHAFTRKPDGTVSSFFIDELLSRSQATGINNIGQTVGTFYSDAPYPPPEHGFVRNRDGSVVSFDFPGADTVTPHGIDDAGNIVGSFNDKEGTIYDPFYVSHGFWRSADGQTNLIIDCPGAIQTEVFAINRSGQIAGRCVDEDGNHAFTATPAVSADVTPPTLALTGFTDDDPHRAIFSVQDSGSGLASIEVQAVPFNGLQPYAIIDPFEPGTTNPVTVTINPFGSIAITAKDVAGTKIRFPPINLDVALHGTVSFSATTYHFAPHPAGETGGPGHVYVRNGTDKSISPSFSVAGSNYFSYSADNCPRPLLSQESCEVLFTFSPPGLGDFNGSLEVVYEGTGSPQTLLLSGSGLGSGLSVSPSNFSFAGHPVGETSGPGKIFVHNFGSNPIAISGATLGGEAATDFQIVVTTCASTLPPYQTCSYTLTTTPTATGFRNATLSVISSWQGSPQTITLQTFGR